MTTRTTTTRRPLLAVSALFAAVASAQQPPSPSTAGGGIGGTVRFASPLHTLTIPDRTASAEVPPSPRSRFLPRFRAGLKAEARARSFLAEEARRKALLDEEDDDDEGGYGEGWAELSAEADKEKERAEASKIEAAYDSAVSRYDAAYAGRKSFSTESPLGSTNEYQFVGVINPKQRGKTGGGEKTVKWYARKRPSHAKWSVRLVHVDRDAIVRDLFARGKVDVFGTYQNTGTTEERTGRPIVTGTYEVRERSWKNLWNFNLKHFFTDSSGMYWRDRRIPAGLYTDGMNVYEASYRYRDGKNGMRRVSPFKMFMASKAVEDDVKERIAKRLKEDSPDVVIEK